MHKGIEMKVMLPIFLMFMSGIAFGEIYYKEEMDKPIRLEAVRNVLGRPVADKIDKDAFVEILKDSDNLLINLLSACSKSVDANLNYEEEIDVCQNFLDQVIAEHNKIISEHELPRKTRFIYPNGNKIYSKDKTFYIAKTKPEMSGFYGVFDDTDTLVCALNCDGNLVSTTLCRPQIYAASVAFACEPKNADLNEFFTDRFLVSYDSTLGGTYFNFEHEYLPGYISVDLSLTEILDNYRMYQIDNNKISASVVDFIDCKNFINKRLSAEKYQFIPENSEIYKEYLFNIDNFNTRAAQVSNEDINRAERNISSNICTKLSYYYTSADALSEQISNANKRIEAFFEQKKRTIDISDSSVNDGRNAIINEFWDAFSPFEAGYAMRYDDDCTETTTTESVERDGTVYLQKDTVTVQCNIRNAYSRTVTPVTYELVSYTGKSGNNNQMDNKNNSDYFKKNLFLDPFINE